MSWSVTMRCPADARPLNLLLRAMEWAACGSVRHVAAVGDANADLQPPIMPALIGASAYYREPIPKTSSDPARILR